jgi:hypothetical protein
VVLPVEVHGEPATLDSIRSAHGERSSNHKLLGSASRERLGDVQSSCSSSGSGAEISSRTGVNRLINSESGARVSTISTTGSGIDRQLQVFAQLLHIGIRLGVELQCRSDRGIGSQRNTVRFTVAGDDVSGGELSSCLITRQGDGAGGPGFTRLREATIESSGRDSENGAGNECEHSELCDEALEELGVKVRTETELFQLLLPFILLYETLGTTWISFFNC